MSDFKTIWVQLAGRKEWKRLTLSPTVNSALLHMTLSKRCNYLTKTFGYTALPVVRYTFRNPDEPKTFAELRKRNLKRCESPNGFNHPLESWTLTDWSNATFGEVGEAANVIKKLKRWEDGIPEETPREELRQKLADEIGDIGVYLDLLAQRAGLRLEDCIFNKFEKTSEKIGYVENEI